MRVLKWLSGCVLSVALVATIVWWWWLPNYRPGLESGEVFGIDVSHHQGPIDWPAVADSEAEFVYIKATEGMDWIDPRFEENWRASSATDLLIGPYHFFTFCSPGREQADHFISIVDFDSADLPPAVDLEIAGNCTTLPSRGEMKTELSTFVELVEQAAGRELVFNVGAEFVEVYQPFEWFDRPEWALNFLRRPGEPLPIWQLGGVYWVEGVDGRVDLNVGALDDLDVRTRE